MADLISRYESIKQATDLTVQEVRTLEPLVNDILTKVVIETLHKYQQKVNVGVQDSISDLLDNFKQKITQEIFDIAGTWKVANREPVMFPRGCRFCWTKGESTIFIIEQDPQIRSLSMAAGMLGQSYSYAAHEQTEYIALALPYVVFIVHFRANEFAGLYCGWRRQPLGDLSDMLCRPLLPNIHDTLNVCTGWSAAAHYGQGSMAERTMNIITNFWSSTFNNDIAEAWWSKFRIHRSLATAKSWAKKSAEDSSFILQVNLHETRSVQYVLDLLVMHEQEPDENAFRHRLSENIDGCIEKLSSGILRYFKKTKFERYHPTEITDVVKQIIQEAVRELADVVFVLDAEVKKLASDVRPASVPMEGLGKYWRDDYA